MRVLVAVTAIAVLVAAGSAPALADMGGMVNQNGRVLEASEDDGWWDVRLLRDVSGERLCAGHPCSPCSASPQAGACPLRIWGEETPSGPGVLPPRRPRQCLSQGVASLLVLLMRRRPTRYSRPIAEQT